MGVNGGWQEWALEHWEHLAEGKVLVISPGELAHPAIADGWKEVFIAEPFGQRADWAYSMPDGSRLHLHEYQDRWAVHRDRHDPSRGIGPAVRHYLEEAPTARIAVAGALGALAVKAARRILLPCLAGLAGFMCGSCRSPAPADVGISPACEREYIMLIGAWASELTVACEPKPVEECGAPKEAINVRYESRFDLWEKRCSE